MSSSSPPTLWRESIATTSPPPPGFPPMPIPAMAASSHKIEPDDEDLSLPPPSDAASPSQLPQPNHDPTSPTVPHQTENDRTPTPPEPQPTFTSSEAAADGFEEFMQLGDASPITEPPPLAPTSNSTPPERSRPESPSPPSPPPNPVAFFTGLFTRATSTIEHTLQTAVSDFPDPSAVISNAQENLSATGASVSNFVAESVGIGRNNPTSPADLAATPLPTQTSTLKQLHAPGSALLHALTPAGILVVTDTALYLFKWDAARITLAYLHITWSSDGSHAVSTPPPPSARRQGRHKSGKPVLATAAVYLPATEEVVTGHEDGALRIFSVALRTFGIAVRAGPADDAVPAILRVVPAAPSRIVVGLRDGSVRIVDSAELRTIAVLLPPEICATPLGVGLRYSPVSCVTVAPDVHAGSEEEEDGGMAFCVGYEDGAVAQGDALGEAIGIPFMAHGRRVSSVCSLYSGIILLTVGNEEDPSLSVFHAQTGRCLVRRMLPYIPASLATVPPPSSREPSQEVCPSDDAFIVGGDEGQLEIFRVVVLSTKRLEIRLVRRISDRVRGRDWCVVEMTYMRVEGVLMALSKNGVLRRWRLNELDASSLSLIPSIDRRKSVYHENNIVERLAQDFVNEGDNLNSVGEVIQAQNVLASILEDDSVSEVQKDVLVVEFQRKQVEMLAKISQADTELKRAGRRVSARFAEGLKARPITASAMDQRLIRAAKRTAAFEMEFATRRHADAVKDIQASTIDKLKILLLNSLKRSRGGESEQLQQIRGEIERLGS